MNELITTADVIVHLSEKELGNLSDEARDWFEWIGTYDRSQLNYGKPICPNRMVLATKKMEIDGTYEGKVDDSGKACGEGMISFPSLDTWQATWKDGKRHGYCKCSNCLRECARHRDVQNGGRPAARRVPARQATR